MDDRACVIFALLVARARSPMPPTVFWLMEMHTRMTPLPSGGVNLNAIAYRHVSLTFLTIHGTRKRTMKRINARLAPTLADYEARSPSTASLFLPLPTDVREAHVAPTATTRLRRRYNISLRKVRAHRISHRSPKIGRVRETHVRLRFPTNVLCGGVFQADNVSS